MGIKRSCDRWRHVTLKDQTCDPNTLRAQYLEKSWRCYLLPIVCCEAVRSAISWLLVLWRRRKWMNEWMNEWMNVCVFMFLWYRLATAEVAIFSSLHCLPAMIFWVLLTLTIFAVCLLFLYVSMSRGSDCWQITNTYFCSRGISVHENKSRDQNNGYIFGVFPFRRNPFRRN